MHRQSDMRRYNANVSTSDTSSSDESNDSPEDQPPEVHIIGAAVFSRLMKHRCFWGTLSVSDLEHAEAQGVETAEHLSLRTLACVQCDECFIL